MALAGVPQVVGNSLVQIADRIIGEGKLTNGYLVKSLLGWNGVALVVVSGAFVLAKLAVDSNNSVKLTTDEHVAEDRKNRYVLLATSMLALIFSTIILTQRHLPNMFGIKV